MLFYLSLLAVLASLVMVGYRYRATLPTRVKAFFPSLNHYTPLASFSDQARAGLSSPMFDIESANIAEGDSRAGLDEQGTQEVLDIMRAQRVNFDQARLIRHNQILARNGIDPSGMPLDSKAVTRL
ncbi:hypothetical protein BDR04DRAFT_1104533 [Suillus decipiens]|uniref:Uncharacterized protein n=2 Tax=Suillus TaxID=5379 RepID=A0A9P7F9U9_9AGAM|nr:uncharacterized protein HD556DRAFT_522264 [Suillus plorans]XP_041294136.1 uncharacterized protein F5147DRAFT_688927 [Suillus discolor]XP_041305899.1 uncharacterized protein EDB93DRAFT_1156474 [Suillus bovinus]XP_041307698.1 uncharacterized protein EDB93DRAFT_1145278 [Suillus bovinus]KAG1811589.1 hypothetical protein EV424DRAFT_1420426 [Suillus variegatus]KAG1878730.1 hypothetical protein C8R48DRAFT_688040 [Suillus tomentosus]KAG2058749.1 hypothetical protein BDR06DRAFT_949987 [Suillus hirt